MKIQRFNESVLLYKHKWNPTDKVLKVKVSDEFEVLIDDIRNTDKFKSYGKYRNPTAKDNWKEEDLFYGLEEYMNENSNPHFDYQLYDGLGNPIEDEEAFDEYVEQLKSVEDYDFEIFSNSKKYNL